MKAIWKYHLSGLQTLSECQRVDMPKGAEIVSCQLQRGEIVVWAIVDDEHELESRYFFVIYTGLPLPGNPYKYLSTLQLEDGDIVLHAFELTS